MKTRLILFLLVATGFSPVLAQSESQIGREPFREIRVYLDGDWIVAEQGRDETAHRVKVAIWGKLREPGFFERRFEQLDGDPEREYILISRNEGTGAYYKVQVIDFRPNGILTWSADSFGKPRIEQQTIYLGERVADGQGPRYGIHRLTVEGLVKTEN